MAVDVHTHLLPMRLASKIRAFFTQHLSEDDLRYTLDYGQLLESHAEEGFTSVWNLPYAHKGGMASALNESMLEVASDFGDRGVAIVSGCTVHPNDPNPEDDLRAAVDDGARVLKLHCSVGDYEPTHPALQSVLAAAGELGVPVTIHAGHSITGHTEASELGPIAEVASLHPDTTLILAHSGHHAYPQAMKMMDTYPNLMCDLTPVIFEPVPISAADANRHRDRLLFGTDAPNTGQTARELLDILRSSGLDDDAFERITTTNATSLLAPS